MIKKEKSTSNKFTKIRFYPFDNDDVRHILQLTEKKILRNLS